MDLALLILSILSCFASWDCLVWNECMWLSRFIVAFWVAKASFLQKHKCLLMLWSVFKRSKNRSYPHTLSAQLEPVVASPSTASPSHPGCQCSPCRSPWAVCRTWPRSPPGPSSPRCQVSVSAWSGWRPRAPCRNNKWDSRRTSHQSCRDPPHNGLQQPDNDWGYGDKCFSLAIYGFTSPSLLAQSHISRNFWISAMVGPVKSSTGMRVCLRSGNA